ncbi:MAG: hypothetical protein LBC63_09100 [Holophagales bacterium]|nr:hypothetical protein [Holophagales bacterium]
MLIPIAREEMEKDLAARDKKKNPSFSEADEARNLEEKEYMRKWFASRSLGFLTPKWAVDDDSLSDLEKFLLETAIDTGARSLTIGDPSTWSGSLKWSRRQRLPVRTPNKERRDRCASAALASFGI